tara:strand:- start:1041 stop:2117 length:1077 start_codon:yes stop_codon:yes gene_type:complete
MENNKLILKKLKKFWKGKKVFLTGHTGFKGSWLCVLLSFLDAKVIGYSLKPKENDLFKLGRLDKLNFKNFYEDILDFKTLNKSVYKFKPNILIHMAAQSLVQRSYKEPRTTFLTNAMGTANILEIIKNNKSIKSSLITTTDKVYKINKNQKKIFKESDILGGNDPYSGSKVCAEIITETYLKSFLRSTKNRISTARSGNVIGGGDRSKDRLLVDILDSIKNKKILKLRYPYAIRPWQHVIEPLIGYLLLIQKQYNKNITNLGYGWNFGPNKQNFQTVKFIVDFFKKKYSLRYKILNSKKFEETRILKLSNNKSKNNLKWSPKWNIEKTLNKIIEWESYKTRKYDLAEICEMQIKSYFK